MKQVLAGLGLGLGMAMAALPTAAQEYPARDIHAICVFPPGSGGDVFVRYFSSKLSDALGGKTVVVENKPGALGNIGSEYVAKAKPDGYTILITPGSSTLAASPHTFKKIGFDPVKDFTPVTTLSKLAFAMVVDPKTPIMTVADLTAHLKKKGDKASYAAATNTGNVATELYKSISGAPALPIPYKDYTVPLPDLIAGNLDFFIADPVFVVGDARCADHGRGQRKGLRRTDCLVVGVRAGRHARSDRQETGGNLQPDRADRGNQEIPGQFRRRPVSRHVGVAEGAAGARPAEMGRVRQAGQDRAAMI